MEGGSGAGGPASDDDDAGVLLSQLPPPLPDPSSMPLCTGADNVDAAPFARLAAADAAVVPPAADATDAVAVTVTVTVVYPKGGSSVQNTSSCVPEAAASAALSGGSEAAAARIMEACSTRVASPTGRREAFRGRPSGPGRTPHMHSGIHCDGLWVVRNANAHPHSRTSNGVSGGGSVLHGVRCECGSPGECTGKTNEGECTCTKTSGALRAWGACLPRTPMRHAVFQLTQRPPTHTAPTCDPEPAGQADHTLIVTTTTAGYLHLCGNRQSHGLTAGPG